MERRSREEQHPDGNAGEADQHHRARSKARDQPRRQSNRERCHRHGIRQKRQADRQRAVLQHALHVERAEKEEPEERGNHQHLDEVGPREITGAEQPQWHQRVGSPCLAGDERDQQRQRETAQSERVPRAQAVDVDLDDGVDAQHQGGCHQGGAEHISSLAQTQAPIGLDQASAEQHGCQPNWQVDEEDPVPAHRLGDDSAGQQADRAARRGDEGEDAQRPCPLRRLGEECDHHTQDHRRADRAADAL